MNLVSLETIPPAQRKVILQQLGCPYALQYKGNLKGDKSDFLGKDIHDKLSESDKTSHTPSIECVCRQKFGQKASEILSTSDACVLKNENRPNPTLDKDRLRLILKLGCSRKYYNQVYKGMQDFSK